MTALSERSLSPEECLLIIGLPLEKGTVMESLQHKNSYASSYLDDPPDTEWAWQKVNDRFVQPCLHAISRVEALGGKVMICAKPADLAAAIASFAVIAIFTHSTWQPFEACQAKDPAALIESLMFGPQLASEVFRSWFVKFQPVNGGDTGEPMSKVILDGLEAACRFSHEWWKATPAERKARYPGSLEAAVAENLCRPEIDRQFADYVRCDKGIELSGGMYGVAEIFGRSAIPVSQKCIFDLRICNSGLLMNSVKELHPESLVVVNQWLANPVFGLLRYIALLQELRNRNCSYLSACERIQRAMADKYT